MKKVLAIIVCLLFALSVTVVFAADKAMDEKAAPAKMEEKKDGDKKAEKKAEKKAPKKAAKKKAAKKEEKKMDEKAEKAEPAKK